LGRYIEVTISTEGLYKVGSRSWGIVGLVGRGIGAGFTVETAYTVKSPTEAATLFGTTSALYKSILLLFKNGATKVIVVPAAVTAETPELFNGDASTVEFTLTEVPTQPIDTVSVSAVSQTEGEDFYVDYGNKKIIFYTAPATGTNNISVTYSTHSATNIEDALDVLTGHEAQIILGAMLFDSASLAKIKEHCAAMETTSPRIAIYMQAKGIATTTLATTLASELSVLLSHKSLKDVAAAAAGKIAGLEPWKDLTMKPLLDIENEGNFTSTEMDAFDAAFMVAAYDPPKLTGSGSVFSTGWTLDTTGTLQFIDQVRTAHHIAGVLEYGLTNPNVIGELRMNRAGLQQLDTYIRSLLTPWVNAGEIDGYDIDNPALRLFETKPPDADDIAAMVALQAVRRLEGAYIITSEIVYSGTIIFVKMKAALTGGAA